eukprot:CAMPEP_0185571976 /NCGR_PEP_ID=MMETSP0434-20130131/3967_1 /TAXON_ID=626734 ORGANISM="Favella taraikaensis, Strain Fe Narragansett Bay" /NCGR_SAMPLE_ID=MMETSP0434 /ASSEMBLY_ACC=CAM_ASM_000379 /LENGTH=65 /DNA_ID=CAMNT_0028187643 /DNA_START=650 /DNA_END=847 /DNA_ORIENTATION=+
MKPGDPHVEVEDMNKIRLEHFQNFKKLRREMDRAYLKVRQMQASGHGTSMNGTSESINEYMSDGK